MTRFNLLLLFTGFLYSACQTSQENKEYNCAVHWQLIEMKGNMANTQPLTGEDMSWQEFYTLKADSTFIKVRRGEKQLTASGKYALIELKGEQFIEFNYSADSEIVASCTADNKELLRLSEGKLYSTWQACDGPGLTYQRTVNNCED